jgi:gluconokinase
MQAPALIVIMGVSGVGKSTIGVELARRMGVGFLEGDSLHPKANIDKMSAGIPLNDDDRFPWLDVIGVHLEAARSQGKSLVVTCSALRRIYRDRLRGHVRGRLQFILLDVPRQLIAARLEQRAGHYMGANLLDSQLNTLELAGPGEELVTLDGTLPVDTLVTAILDGP